VAWPPRRGCGPAAFGFLSGFALFSGAELELLELLLLSDEELVLLDELLSEDEDELEESELLAAFSRFSAILASFLSAPSEADFSSSRLRFFVP
jgi:hypothetical protein